MFQKLPNKKALAAGLLHPFLLGRAGTLLMASPSERIMKNSSLLCSRRKNVRGFLVAQGFRQRP